MNPSELNYQVVSTFEHNYKGNNMEQGKTSPQYITGVIVNLASMAVGTTLGWTSPVNPKLNEPEKMDSPLSRAPTTQELSWIGSLVALGALIAPFIAGPLADKIGRKWTLLGSTAFFVASWILLLIGGNVWLLYLARLLQGFGVGFVMTVQPMYIGEISSDECRGALGSFMQLFIVTGILYVYAIGPYVSYWLLQWACLAVTIAFAATFFFMPESPMYFLAKGQKEDAVESLKYFRGKSAAGVQDELQIMQGVIEESQKKQATVSDLFNNKGNFKALIISAGLLAFQQLSGINAVLFFSQDIFKMAAGEGGGLDPAISTILVGAVMVIASGITPLIADKLGRKVILGFSALFMAISLAVLGFYFLASDNKWEIAATISWLPVVSLIVFVLVYCVGFGPLPWAVMGEMFAPEVKSVASSMVASTCWILGFLVTKYFQSISEALGAAWAFWIFGICCGCAFAFVLFVVLETKGLSLQQIQDKLNGK